jgi:hypothetical protein
MYGLIRIAELAWLMSGTPDRDSIAPCWMLDAGCWMLDAGCWMLDAGCWMLDAGCDKAINSDR